MLVKGIIESISADGYTAKVRIPQIHRVATDPLGIPTEELDDATILSIPGVMPVYKINDVVFVLFENDKVGAPVVLGLLERSGVSESSARLSGETSINLATNEWVSEELKKRDVQISEKLITSTLNSYSTNINDRQGHWTVSIPNIERYYEGLTVKVTITTDPYTIEGYNTVNINNIGPAVVFSPRTEPLDDNDSIRGSEYFLTYHTTGLGPYTVTSDMGALPIGTIVTSGWVVTGGAGGGIGSEEFNALVTRVDGLERDIDARLQNYVGEETPTLYNYPCNTWEGKDYVKHIGNVYTNITNGDSFRFIAQLTAMNLFEYPYDLEEGWTEINRGVTFKLQNNVITYSGTPSSTGTDLPYIPFYKDGSRLHLTAGQYTMIVSTPYDPDQVGLDLQLYAGESGSTRYTGGGTGILSDGYTVITTMEYDDVSWSEAVNSGFQKTVTFTIDDEAWVTAELLTTNAEPVSGYAQAYLYASELGFEWIQMSDSEIAGILERLGIAEGTIEQHGLEIEELDDRFTRKVWQTDIDSSINNIKIGHTNLLADTNTESNAKVDSDMDKEYFTVGSGSASISYVDVEATAPTTGLKYGVQVNITESTSTSAGRALVFRNSKLNLVDGQTYTLSTYIKILSGNCNIKMAYKNRAGQSFVYDLGNHSAVNYSKWTQISKTFTYSKGNTTSYTYDQIFPVYACNNSVAQACEIQFCGMKLELGNKSTDWEETVVRTVSLQTQHSTLSQTVSGISTEVGSLQTQMTTKADNTRVDTVVSDVSRVDQKADGIAARVTTVEEAVTQLGITNLVCWPYQDSSKIESGITWTINANNSVTASGRSSGISKFSLQTYTQESTLIKADTYNFHGCPSDGSASSYYVAIAVYNSSRTSHTTYYDMGSGVTFTTSADSYVQITLIIAASNTVNLTFYPMLEKGDTAHAYINPETTTLNRLSRAEATLDIHSTEIASKVSETTYEQGMATKADNTRVGAVETRMTTAESTITQHSTDIQSRVTYTDYNGNEIASRINQTATTVAIDAEKIDLNGKVTIGHLATSAKGVLTKTTTSSYQFYLSDSSTETTGGTWQDSAPTWASNKYVWKRLKTIVTYVDDTVDTVYGTAVYDKTLTDSLVSGKSAGDAASAAQTTANGSVRSVTSKNQYYLSTSSSSATGGSWSDNPPTWQSGTYIWTRVATTTTPNTGSPTTTYSTAKYDVTLTEACAKTGGSINLLCDTNTNSMTKVDAKEDKYLSDSSFTDITGQFTNLTDPPVPGIKYGYKLTSTAVNTHSRNLTFINSDLHLIVGETYTLSTYARIVSGTNARLKLVCDNRDSSMYQFTKQIDITNTDWKQYSYTFTYTESPASTETYNRISPSGIYATSVCAVEFCGMKLEKGTTATDWCESAVRYATIESKVNSATDTIVPVYYRSTTTDTPPDPVTAEIITTDDTDNKWSYVQLKPTNSRYYWICNEKTSVNNAKTYTDKRKQSELDVVASWCNTTDKTTIDGSHIYTGTITSDQIAANAITVGKIANNTVDLNAMQSGTKATLSTSTDSNLQYYLSTSSSSATGGSWSDTEPTWSSGKYVWLRTKNVTTKADSTTNTTYVPSANGYYDATTTKALMDAATGIANAATADAKAVAAQTSANNAQTTANAAYKSVVPIYYRSTTQDTPSAPAPGATIGTTEDTDNVWSYLIAKPKNGRYFFYCNRCVKSDNSVVFSTVYQMSNMTASSLWCSTNDATFIDGGKIYANSVTANQMAANSITITNMDSDTKSGIASTVKSTWEYALSTSTSTAPTSGWSTTAPTSISSSQYVWKRLATYKVDLTGTTTGTASYGTASCDLTLTKAIKDAATGIANAATADGKAVAAQATANGSLNASTSKLQYYLSTSSTEATGGEWSDNPPTWESGKYVWTRVATTVTTNTSASSTTYSTPKYDITVTAALMQANSSAKHVTSKTQYYLSTSSTEATGGTWSDDPPTWTSGKYIWTRICTTTTLNSDATTVKYNTAKYDVTLTEASSKAASAQTIANGTYKDVVPVYYRSTSSETPTITSSTAIGTDDDTDDAWSYLLQKPKNGKFFFTCNRCVKADNSVVFSTVRQMSNLTASSLWCSTNDATYISGSSIYAGSIQSSQIATGTIEISNLATAAKSQIVTNVSTITQYGLSTSTTTAPTSWSSSIPAWKPGYYIWTRGYTTRTFLNGSTSTPTSGVYDAGLTEALSNSFVNLIPYPYYEKSLTRSGITWTINADGSVTANGTATSTSYITLKYKNSSDTLPAGSYYLSGCPSGGSTSKYYMRLFEYTSDLSSSVNVTDVGNGAAVTMTTSYPVWHLNLYVYNGQTASNLTFYPTIVSGSRNHGWISPVSKTDSSFKSIVPIYYRRYNQSAVPTAPTTIVTETADDTDNVWTLSIPKPKNGRSFFQCNMCIRGNSSYPVCTAVTQMSDLTASSLWCHSQDSTLIDGSSIFTGTVTADKISVTDLQALGATIGGWTISSTAIYKDAVIDSKTYRPLLNCPTSITANTSAFAVYNATDGTYPFRVKYNGALTATNANISGTITATGGKIGGWTIGSTSIQKSVTIDDITYTPMLYAPDSPVVTNLAFGIQKREGSTTSYPFVVNYNGHLNATDATITGTVTSSNLTATGGEIGGWVIQSDALYKRTTSGTTRYYAAIYSNATSGSNYAFATATSTDSGSTWTWPFIVTYDGTLNTNKLSANGGTIGSWTINETSIKSGDAASGTESGMQNSSKWAFYAGYKSDGTYKFRVTQAGALTATNATITGSVTTSNLKATGGSIGGWNINSSSIYSGSESSGTESGMVKQGSGYAFYAGWNGSTARFAVTHEGIIYGDRISILNSSGTYRGGIDGTLSNGVAFFGDYNSSDMLSLGLLKNSSRNTILTSVNLTRGSGDIVYTTITNFLSIQKAQGTSTTLGSWGQSDSYTLCSKSWTCPSGLTPLMCVCGSEGGGLVPCTSSYLSQSSGQTYNLYANFINFWSGSLSFKPTWYILCARITLS